MLRILQDIRFGFRVLLKNPGFAAVAVLTLALGIGFNSAIFSLVDAVILRPLPYPEPEQLVGLGQWRNQQGEGYIQTGVSAPNLEDIAKTGIFQNVAYYRWSGFNITEGSRPESVQAIKASAELLPMFAVAPRLGRYLAQPNIDDESKRRRTLTQLNRDEERHKLARAISHGKRGELRQRYREGQEDQLGALGLVVNIIILWNTLYLSAALDQRASRASRLFLSGCWFSTTPRFETQLLRALANRAIEWYWIGHATADEFLRLVEDLLWAISRPSFGSKLIYGLQTSSFPFCERSLSNPVTYHWRLASPKIRRCLLAAVLSIFANSKITELLQGRNNPPLASAS